MRRHVYISRVTGRPVKNRRHSQRLFRFITAMIAILISGVFIGLGAGRIFSHAESLDTEHYYRYYKSVMIMPGDTLTSIASSYNDHYDSVEAHVDEIRFTNHLAEDAAIYAGEYLIVPYYSTEFN
ncbi:MAG: LysM peptidoglycan-binding domain-containing protein [Lachnospiraceae bacterium]|nr:LysM peptidoglycan-binding domain-containing protein [Lachnospiraceae bacterium]